MAGLPLLRARYMVEEMGTDASDCLYLALNGRMLRARYMPISSTM